MSSAAEPRYSPGIDQSRNTPGSDSRRSTSASSRATISPPICGMGLRDSGFVEMADPTAKSSR